MAITGKTRSSSRCDVAGIEKIFESVQVRPPSRLVAKYNVSR